MGLKGYVVVVVVASNSHEFFILWQHQSQMAMGQMGGANMANLAAMEQSRMLAQTLASNNDPKFQV